MKKAKGRPAKQEADKLVNRQVRFSDAQWADVKLIGVARLRQLAVREAAKMRRALVSQAMRGGE